MARPTEKERYEMRTRTLIKKVYSENLGRPKEEITSIIPANLYAYRVKIKNEETIVLRSALDDYFNARNAEERKYSIKKIAEALGNSTTEKSWERKRRAEN